MDPLFLNDKATVLADGFFDVRDDPAAALGFD